MATQALQTPSPMTGTFITGQFTGSSVQNVYSDPSLHRDIMFSSKQTPFKANMLCATGSAGANNSCVCPGSSSGVPFRQSPPALVSQSMSSLFFPMTGGYSPQITSAVQTLLKQRSPIPKGQPSGYSSMDSMSMLQ